MNFNLSQYFKKNTETAPLAVFRIFFGIMMLLSIVRFWSYGWIETLYIKPKFFFSYYGFEWIRPLGIYTYLIFIICAISALMVALGFKYRISIIIFFLSFTYIELMDKTTYLNHYYFISVLSFLMIFLPANAYYALDARKRKSFKYIPVWTIDSVKLLLGIVYFYAGLAKLNSDWLVKAMPLKIWLPSNYDLPVLGDLMQQEWVHYLFSYTGAIYDLTIPFLLLFRKTRNFAFIMVVVFHVLTRILFPIGMFPYIMIISTLIFFDSKVHYKILAIISKVLKINQTQFDTNRILTFKPKKDKILIGIITVLFTIQLLLPFRYLLYPGELFWTEEGYRFSWRVMLMEKAGYANFKIVDSKTGKRFYVDNNDFLTAFQEKQMATQPDFILQYAHYLKKHFENRGHQNVQVFVESYVALNGRLSSQYIDPETDLGKQKETFKHKTWIIPFKDEIKGL
ncbi:HTTM domain-containing protein [Aquimarina sp. AD10]|uniref:HTTM domain-containing protein n=1 Tax=Aquimarina sp. AD10 TaxID=1714849 RepID=UPI000E4F4605|nr:HTTM domain-containing protein [Aquimarina sp. AD10]AXT60618.1 HTTM domain-containing protein [Aquimarina sp. AD10]RKN01711.1 HTTM domain-containing protein [Aquimarina sp. AD10]